jgi:BirA family biotin operon repressor/biotin-[acetyl-CoA-carboxylase] ligase
LKIQLPIYEHYNFDKITSTNDYARELLNKDLVAIVSANYQSKGRGRNTNTWYGSYGNNVYLSIAIKHIDEIDSDNLPVFQALSSLIVINSLKRLYPKVKFALKYPNDVYAFVPIPKESDTINPNYRKISGVLVEHSFMGSFCTSTIIGIGINVSEQNFPPEIADNSTSLDLLGYNASIEEIIKAIINELYYLADNNDAAEIFDLWKYSLNLTKKQIQVVGDELNYTFSRILDDGRLELIRNKQRIIIDNGDSIRYNLD